MAKRAERIPAAPAALRTGREPVRPRRPRIPRPNAVDELAGRLFDARPDRVDLRDRPYVPPLRSLAPVFPGDRELAGWLPGYIAAGLVRDQGRDGACTGFGLACVINFLYWIQGRAGDQATPVESVSPRMLYELARRYDEWPGEQYDGSSCRGALKGWHKHGVCSEALWRYRDDEGNARLLPPEEGWERDAIGRPLGVYYRVDRQSIVDVQAAIADIGAVYASVRTHAGWNGVPALPVPRHHGEFPVIPLPLPADKKRGGHALALIGYNDRGFVVQNSWGTGWGAQGFAVLRYDDWIVHATDAWVCALGVPQEPTATRIAGIRWPVASGRSLSTREAAAKNPHNPPDDPWPIDHEYLDPACEPWSSAAAYAHTLIAGNDGTVEVADVTRGVAGDAAVYVRDIAVVRPLAWAADNAATTLKLVVYAHGGLNSESESIARIRVLAPYFEANGIYPLFLTWKTGPIDTLQDVFADKLRAFFGLDEQGRSGALLGIDDEQWDRGVERLARFSVKGLWSEMRENARRGARQGHLLQLLADALLALSDACAGDGRRLDVHLVAHSAGAIVHGHLLDCLGAAPAPLRVGSCSLLAAACSARFALAHYVDAHPAVLLPDRIALHHLSDGNEKDDCLVGNAASNLYGKSLLYLVSRALDDERKMPLLGMERVFDPACNTRDYWAASELASLERMQTALAAAAKLPWVAPEVRVSRTGASIPASHGSFDNNIDIITALIQRIAGSAPLHPIEWLDY